MRSRCPRRQAGRRCLLSPPGQERTPVNLTDAATDSDTLSLPQGRNGRDSQPRYRGIGGDEEEVPGRRWEEEEEEEEGEE